jgi:NDP-sugar pyrophosphorylase family protein
LFVLNGDILTDPDLSEMRRLHETHGSRTTIYLQPVPDPRQYGLVETEADGRLRAFREKPTADEQITTNTINAGIYLIDAELLGRIPRDRASSIEREFFPALIADGVPCFGWCPSAYWRDIGNPSAYRAAQMDLLQGRAAMPLAPPGQDRDGIWLGAGGTVDPTARIVAPAVVGAGVVLGPGCRVGPGAVLGDHARIGPDAQIEGAILWERVEVGAGALLQDCVLGADVKIGAGARVGPDVVLASGTTVPERATLTR